MKNIIFTLALLSTFALQAKEKRNYWIGSLEGMLIMELRIDENNSEVKGSFRSPMQSNQSFPATVEITGDSISWGIASLQIKYAGRIDRDKQQMVGQFKQGGFSSQLTLQQSDKEFSLVRPQTPKEPFPYETEEICFQNGQVKICGTLTLPAEVKKAALVILLTGSGPQNRDEEIFGHKPFAVIADTLAKAGIASFRMDDRGAGKSGGDLNKSTYEDLSQDLSIAIDLLSKHKKIDRKRISLLGHSEGSNFVLMFLAKDDRIEKGVCLAGPGVDGKSVLLNQNQKIYHGKISDSLIAVRLGIMEANIDLALSDLPEAEKKSKMLQTVREGLSGLTAEQKMGLGFSPQAEQLVVQQLLSVTLLNILRFDPLPYLTRIQKPILALNGAKDVQVDATMNLEGFRLGLTQAGNTHFVLKSYPDLNHLFQHCQSGDLGEYAVIEETISKEVLGDIVNFLNPGKKK